MKDKRFLQIHNQLSFSLCNIEVRMYSLAPCREDIAWRRDRENREDVVDRRAWGRDKKKGNNRSERWEREGKTGRHRCARHRVGARSLIGQSRHLLLAFFSSPLSGRDRTWNLEESIVTLLWNPFQRQLFEISFYFCSNLILRNFWQRQGAQIVF